MKRKIQNREKRIKSIRKKIFRNVSSPRVVVFRSNKHIYAQVIDDQEHKTLAFASDAIVKSKKGAKPVEVAKEVGKLLSEEAIKNKVSKVVFDRRGYKYHGRVRALADGAREGGLIF